MKHKVTVVIPAKNEEKTIRGITKEVRPYCDEILVVSAKSATDNTRKIVKSLGVKLLVDNGKGKGAGLRYAIRNINEGIIVFMDADGSHITKDIPKLVQPIKDGRADLVIASRMYGGSMELHGTFNKLLRLFASMCMAQIINWRYGKAITDVNNGFRAIKAKVAKKLNLKANTFDVEVEMCMRCFKMGYKVTEVPSMELERKFGHSGLSLWKASYIFLYRVIVNL
jgi:dolichol-phosphate hexosyltransferase